MFGWPNLCGVANAEQWDKKITDIYGYFMELVVGNNLETFTFKDKDVFEDEIWGVFSKGRDRGKLHIYTILFSPDRLAQLFLLKELNPLLIAKSKNF